MTTPRRFKMDCARSVTGVPQNVAIITCGICHATDQVGADGSDMVLTRKFIARGWHVGLGDVFDQCPRCEAASAIKESGMTKSMTRADRRAIVEKLQDVYLNEVTGYSPGWTDAKVATELDRPRAWVTQIREEIFGPEKANDDIRTALDEAKRVLADSKAIEPMLREILQRAEKIEKTMVSIEDALK